MPKIDKELNTHYPLFDSGLYTEVVHQNGERAIKILTGNYAHIFEITFISLNNIMLFCFYNCLDLRWGKFS